MDWKFIPCLIYKCITKISLIVKWIIDNVYILKKNNLNVFNIF